MSHPVLSEPDIHIHAAATAPIFAVAGKKTEAITQKIGLPVPKLACHQSEKRYIEVDFPTALGKIQYIPPK
jgi:hypothetical protein